MVLSTGPIPQKNEEEVGEEAGPRQRLQQEVEVRNRDELPAAVLPDEGHLVQHHVRRRTGRGDERGELHRLEGGARQRPLRRRPGLQLPLGEERARGGAHADGLPRQAEEGDGRAAGDRPRRGVLLGHHRQGEAVLPVLPEHRREQDLHHRAGDRDEADHGGAEPAHPAPALLAGGLAEHAAAQGWVRHVAVLARPVELFRGHVQREVLPAGRRGKDLIDSGTVSTLRSAYRFVFF